LPHPPCSTGRYSAPFGAVFAPLVVNRARSKERTTMQIHSVLAGYADLAAACRGETAEAGGRRASEAAAPQTPSPSPAMAAMAEILGRYDVSDISPTEFSEMIQKLFEAGALSQQELQQLAAVRLDLDAEGVESDESIDLLEFYAEKIRDLQRRLSDSDSAVSDRPQIAPLLERLDWLEKFALIQAAPDSIGLDAVG
jgi:hypothetical protein